MSSRDTAGRPSQNADHVNHHEAECANPQQRTAPTVGLVPALAARRRQPAPRDYAILCGSHFEHRHDTRPPRRAPGRQRSRRQGQPSRYRSLLPPPRSRNCRNRVAAGKPHRHALGQAERMPMLALSATAAIATMAPTPARPICMTVLALTLSPGIGSSGSARQCQLR